MVVVWVQLAQHMLSLKAAAWGMGEFGWQFSLYEHTYRCLHSRILMPVCVCVCLLYPVLQDLHALFISLSHPYVCERLYISGTAL